MRTTSDSVSVNALSELLYPQSLTRYVKFVCMNDFPREEVHMQAQSACKLLLCLQVSPAPCMLKACAHCDILGGNMKR